jgi:hypothetical protein
VSARRIRVYLLAWLQVATVFPILAAILLIGRLGKALYRWGRLDVAETWREHWRAVRGAE